MLKPLVLALVLAISTPEPTMEVRCFIGGVASSDSTGMLIKPLKPASPVQDTVYAVPPYPYVLVCSNIAVNRA